MSTVSKTTILEVIRPPVMLVFLALEKNELGTIDLQNQQIDGRTVPELVKHFLPGAKENILHMAHKLRDSKSVRNLKSVWNQTVEMLSAQVCAFVCISFLIFTVLTSSGCSRLWISVFLFFVCCH